MWHREGEQWCGPGWGHTSQMNSNTEELNEANVKFRHQNAELVGANFKLRNQNAQLRRWCNHLGSVVASQKQWIESIQADLEDVRTERDNLLAAGRHFDAVHRKIVYAAPPAPHAELVPGPATTLNMNIPNNGGEVDRTVSGVYLDGFLSPRTNCDPTTPSSFAELNTQQKEEVKRRLLTNRGPASARGGGRGKALPLATSSTGSPESLQKANVPSTSPQSNPRSSDSPQEACIPTANTSALVAPSGTGSSTSVIKADVAPVSPEERLLMSSTETSGKCIRAPYEGIMDKRPSASPPKANVGLDLTEGTLRVSSIEPIEECSKTLPGSVIDTTTGSQGEGQVPRGPFMSGNLVEESLKQGDEFSGGAGPGGETDDDCLEEGAATETDEPGNLGEESSKQGDDFSGGAGPGGETDDDCLEEGAATETDEPGPTEHESETPRIDSGGIPPGISSSDEACRSEPSTEFKPDVSSPQRPNAQISGEASILDSPNSVLVSKARDSQNELVAGSGSAADLLKINESDSVEPCNGSADFAESRRPEPLVRSPAVMALRSVLPAERETSKHAQGNLNVSATRASSAWSSRYPHKIYSRNSTHDSGSCGSQGKDRQDRVDPGGSGGNETSDEDEISSDRYTHVTHCCWCFNERLESQAVALCEGCPRIMCRQCMVKVGLRAPSGDNSRDSILPASSCRCLKLDIRFREPPRTAQPEAYLLKQLRRHDLSLQFRKPVDIESNPNYLGVITKEKMMDLATMTKKMKNRCYVTPRGQRKFLLDLQQIWSNCWKYAQYDPENQGPMPGIVSCTLILANMVDEYCRSNMEVPTLTFDDKSWLAAMECLKQRRFCEMVKSNPRNSTMNPPMKARQGSVEEHRMNDGPSSSDSVKRKFSRLSSADDDLFHPNEVISGTLHNLADVGDRLVQEAKRRRETRNEC